MLLQTHLGLCKSDFLAISKSIVHIQCTEQSKNSIGYCTTQSTSLIQHVYKVTQEDNQNISTDFVFVYLGPSYNLYGCPL